MLVSVLIRVHNRSEFLEQALDSVLNQTYKNLEIVILYDGDKNHKAFEIVSSFKDRDERIKLYFNDRTKLISYNYVYGFNLCTGDYLAEVDSDDILLPTAIERVMSYFEVHPLVDFVYTDCAVIDAENNYIKQDPRSLIPYSQEAMLKSFITFHLRVFKRWVWERVSSFIIYPSLCPDYQISLLASKICEIKRLPEILYHYRRHDKNMSKLKYQTTLRDSQRAIQIAKKFKNY